MITTICPKCDHDHVYRSGLRWQCPCGETGLDDPPDRSDYFGIPLSLGDTVAFMHTAYRHFMIGRIQRISEQFIQIEHGKGRTGRTRQRYDQVIKVISGAQFAYCRYCGERDCTFDNPQCEAAIMEHKRARANGMPASGRYG